MITVPNVSFLRTSRNAPYSSLASTSDSLGGADSDGTYVMVFSWIQSWPWSPGSAERRSPVDGPRQCPWINNDNINEFNKIRICTEGSKGNDLNNRKERIAKSLNPDWSYEKKFGFSLKIMKWKNKRSCLNFLFGVF